MRDCTVPTYSHDVADCGTVAVALTLRGAAKLKENDFQSSSVRELRIGLYWSTNFSHETRLRVILYVRTAYVFTFDIQGLTSCFTTRMQPEVCKTGLKS